MGACGCGGAAQRREDRRGRGGALDTLEAGVRFKAAVERARGAASPLDNIYLRRGQAQAHRQTAPILAGASRNAAVGRAAATSGDG